MRLPQFTTKRRVDVEFHLFLKIEKDRYKFIIGCDILQQLGFDIINSKQLFAWDGIEVGMISREHWNTTIVKIFWTAQNTVTEDEQVQIQEDIKQTEYEKANLEKLVKSLLHLNTDQQDQLLPVLKKHESAFAGTRGNWNGKKIELELKEDAKPYQIPQAYHDLYKWESIGWKVMEF